MDAKRIAEFRDWLRFHGTSNPVEECLDTIERQAADTERLDDLRDVLRRALMDFMKLDGDVNDVIDAAMEMVKPAASETTEDTEDA